MSFVGQALGSVIGQQGPQAPNTINPFGTAGQAQDAVAADRQRIYNNLGQQQDFANAVNPLATNAAYQQVDVFGQQQNLANQLSQQAQGVGPNPAQAQFNQNTGQNVAGQAALMAGQRGSGANAGLLARQVGMQGGAMQQQATGQAATLQAQQQIAAQQQLAQQQQALQSNLGQQIGVFQNAAQQNSGNSLQLQSNELNAINNQNQAALGASGQANQANQANSGQIAGLFGSAGQAAAGSGGLFKAAHGGMAPDTNETTVQPDKGWGKIIIIDNHKQAYAHGGCASNVGNMLKSGGHVPGQAAVAGDSSKNDTVNAKLSPGEIVIPRSIATHPNAPSEAAKFVAAILAKQGR